ncbi:MAG: DUF4330 domain-containing protein [Ruminiclostridium sp.]
MKLIDEKGRFFGKVNLIDLVVVFLAIFLVTAFCYKVLAPKISTSQLAQGEVTALIKCASKTESVAEAIRKGQKLVFGTDYIEAATITDVSYSAADSVTTDFQGNLHMIKHPILKDVFITIQAKVNTNAAILKVGSQELCQGKKFTVKTHTLEIDGTVESLTLNK